MKVTEKQLLVLIRVLEGSLAICDRSDMNLFGYTIETRRTVLDQILNQQSNSLIDVSPESEDKGL